MSRHSPKIKNNNNQSDFFACCTSYTGKLQGARAPAVKFHKMSRLYISTFRTKEIMEIKDVIKTRSFDLKLYIYFVQR